MQQIPTEEKLLAKNVFIDKIKQKPVENFKLATVALHPPNWGRRWAW